MPFIMNASSQEQQVRVHGAWFTFKAKQVKEMHEEKVAHLSTNCSHLGFVSLPETYADLEFRNSPEGVATLKSAEDAGVKNRIQHLESLKKNELVALQRDIDRSGSKYDARLEVNEEVLKQLEELANYKIKNEDVAQQRVDRIRELEKKLESLS